MTAMSTHEAMGKSISMLDEDFSNANIFKSSMHLLVNHHTSSASNLNKLSGSQGNDDGTEHWFAIEPL